ncbi:AraC family transcriptional regulator [Idiomarina sp. M1R2S28]|uniref:AraC family transcriptional regulator n=1 Tax=Idiomarina rhizosphaerae TaxID=2961572 RepID=A0A9X2FZS1_9GAMM|nr:AraC family transcriptional regulator [Idiomarina rhizosphaerae]
MKNYQDRFVEVVNYIEANLDSNLDIEKLCQLAYLSKYHFHRQCSAFFGMTVMSLVKVLRLKRAAYQLAYRSDTKIVDIALASGYESHEAFCRAFKKLFNKTPSDFKHSPDWTPWHSHYEPVLKLRTKIMNDKVNLNVEVVEFPETLIATLEHRGSPRSLGNSIRNFIEWRKENRLPPGKSKTFNLLYDDPNIIAPEDYRFDLCCSIQHRIEENADGILNKVIPAGKCAVIRHIGSDDALGEPVNYLYSEWLPESSFELRDFPIFLERVSFFPDVQENDSVTDIYLPVK